jgi:hypothetical protein
MKKPLMLLLLLLTTSIVLFAQNEKYMHAMTSSIEAFQKATSKEPSLAELTEIANRFERIASAEPTEWLPRYYAAYTYSTLAYAGNDLTQKDLMADKAATLLKETIAIAGENSELMVLDAQIKQARLAADPMTRWQTYGPLFEASLAKAEALNKDNPRIYVLRGTTLMYTPEQFGGGKKAAKPLFEKALEKFATFKPESTLHPNWGERQASWMLAQCNQ